MVILQNEVDFEERNALKIYTKECVGWFWFGFVLFFKQMLKILFALCLCPFFMYLYEWETGLRWNEYRSFSKEP